MSIDVLQGAIRKLKNPTMLGLDPTPEWIPPHLLSAAIDAHGETPKAMASAYETFCTGLLNALEGTVPAVKFQSACFYALGAAGVKTLQRLTEYASAKGYYVALDLLRCDVEHIAAILAQALFAGVRIGSTCYRPYTVDAITINGYTGSDGVKPFLPFCKDCGKNLFLTVKTSNRSAYEVQELLAGDRFLHTAMADMAMRWSKGLIGECGYSQVGIIAAATYPNALKQLRTVYDRLFLMVPGYGVQGGTGKNAQYAFDQLGHGAIVTASRSLMGAWKLAESDGRDYQTQAVAAAERMKNNLLKYVVIL